MLLYFGNPTSSPAVHEEMKKGRVLGMITTPLQGNRQLPGVLWCADNGCYGKGFPGEAKWFAWLESMTRHDVGLCAFATAPDVVGDAAATIERSSPWLQKIRGIGYPAALVAQDGMNELPVPWDDFDCLFIGGSDEWKLGPDAEALSAEAKARGKWLHMGRVNSRKRMIIAKRFGCDSLDGTYLRFGPDRNLVRLLRFLAEAEAA